MDNLAQKKLVLQKTIAKYKSELARIKEQEVLERAEAEVYREKIQHVDAAIEEKSGGLQLLKEQLKKLNPIVAHLQELYEAAVQKEGEVEKEIRSINVIQQLDNELQVCNPVGNVWARVSRWLYYDTTYRPSFSERHFKSMTYI